MLKKKGVVNFYDNSIDNKEAIKIFDSNFNNTSQLEELMEQIIKNDELI